MWMRVLIYAGQAAAREQVIDYALPIVQRVASAITLVTGGGAERQSDLVQAAQELHIPADVPVTLLARAGAAQQAIMQAAAEQQYDLVIFGAFQQPLTRLLPAARTNLIRQPLQPSVLHVHGRGRPIRNIMLASGGDYHTFDDVQVAARLAGPLGATITLVHVIADSSLVYPSFAERRLSIEDVLLGFSPEASTLRSAASLLRQRGITAVVRGRTGPVLDTLLDELRTGAYDLLVVGAHQIASPLDRILGENITGELLDLSPLPVLVVKGHHV
jgi:nucleotide-binding universal stress UspA family protein